MKATCAGSAAASEGEAALSAGAAAFLAASSMALVWASTSLARSFVFFSMPSPSTNLQMRPNFASQRQNIPVKCCEYTELFLTCEGWGPVGWTPWTRSPCQVPVPTSSGMCCWMSGLRPCGLVTALGAGWSMVHTQPTGIFLGQAK